MHYKIMPTEEYTKDEQLTALLSLIGTRAIDPQVAQAAAWHLSSQMSWEQLASKRSNEIAENELPYFAPQALVLAQQLVIDVRGVAHERAVEREKSGQTKKKPQTSTDNVIKGR
jgi:hypothetical protein